MTLDGVRVIREGTSAIVVHDCDPVIRVRIELGGLAPMLSDLEIVERYHQRIIALASSLIDAPQLRWDEARARWQPAGRAVRCIVEASTEPTVWIDELELTIAELATLLSSHGAHVCLIFLDD